jgi:hypothetical protein
LHVSRRPPYEHSGTSIAGNKPISIGQGYSTIAWIPEKSGSWALPLRHERITSEESPISKAIWLLLQVCKYLPVRPISVWDSEYGCAPFVLKTASIPADILVRLRSNLCLWGEPGAYSGKGCPRKHGDKFKLNEPTTWGEAASVFEVDDPKLKRVRVSLWKICISVKRRHALRSMIRVERIDEQGNQRISKPLWLAWVGEEMPPIEEIWRQYYRRFTIDHWYRFLKQRLHWTVPTLMYIA